MDFQKALIDSTIEIFPSTGMNIVYLGVSEQAQFISANQVNVLVGLSGHIKGNLIIGFNKTALPNILLGATNKSSINDLNASTQSILCRLANMIIKNTVDKVYSKDTVSLSLPTVITGQQLFLMISRIKSKKLIFKINNEFFNISYSLE